MNLAGVPRITYVNPTGLVHAQLITFADLAKDESQTAQNAEGLSVGSPVLRVEPNPSHRGETRIRLSGGKVLSAPIEIFDTSGRRVRALKGNPRESGFEVTWDGLDTTGHPVAAGTYFVLACHGADRLAERIHLIR
jgi:hypothetical protein